MKKKIILLALITSSILNAAKLIYTNSNTPIYEGTVKYAKRTQESYRVRNYFYDSIIGTAENEIWKKLMGTSRDTFNILLVKDSNYKDKFSADGYHMLGMLRAFEFGAGKGYAVKNSHNVFITSKIAPQQIQSGLVTISTMAPSGSRSNWTKDSIYFGDVINELAGSYHITPRFLGITSDNSNLYVEALPNDNTVNKEKRLKGDDVEAVTPSQETFSFPMFGTEVQKMFRSDRIRVKDFSCGLIKNPKQSFGNIRGIDGDYEKNTEEPCTVNDNRGAGKYPSYALYARAETIIADGQVNDGERFSSGASYAAPRVSGVISVILDKFKGLSYSQAKNILLTTAKRDYDMLDTYIGWGIVDKNKALNGPAALNAGLIEEQKFFTGMYDKIFDGSDNIYFWADVQNEWKWTNDIQGNLKSTPSGETILNTVINTTDEDGDASNVLVAFATVRNVNFKNIIPSEYNYYESTSKYKPGLRKAGKGTLITTGNLNYPGRTEILEGKMIMKGSVPKSEIYVYEGATLEISGENYYQINLVGGNLTINGNPNIQTLFIENDNWSINGKGDLRIGKVIANEKVQKDFKNSSVKVEEYSNKNSKYVEKDIIVNPKKYQDIPREYFFSDFKSEIKNFSTRNSQKVYNEMVKRYTKMENAPEKVKEIVPGYKNGKFLMDTSPYSDPTRPEEFTTYPNPVFSNDTSLSIKKKDFEITNFKNIMKNK